MNNFTLFWRIYVKKQYENLGKGARMGFEGLFARVNPTGLNPFTIYDHGLLWRVLRDVVVLFSTALRIVVGVLMLALLVVSLPVLTVLRAVLIPLIGLVRGCRVAWILRDEPDEKEDQQ